MSESLPFDPTDFRDPNEGRMHIDAALSFDPFYGSASVANDNSLMNPKEYDRIVGLAWMAERVYGREAASRFLLENGIKPFPEA